MKLDEIQIGIALVWLVVAFAGHAMPYSVQTSSFEVAGSLANSIAFPISAFAGFLYRFFPLMKQSKLAKPQMLFFNAGLALMVLSGFLASHGISRDLITFGSVFAFGGILLLIWIWWFDRAPRN
jgi:hypothetical protein